MTDPFGFWWMFANNEERKEYADAINQAFKDLTIALYTPAALAIVLSAALIV